VQKLTYLETEEVANNVSTIFTAISYLVFQYIIGKMYSLRPIILFANIDISRHTLVVDISVFAK
jgi:hypothetical protein